MSELSREDAIGAAIDQLGNEEEVIESPVVEAVEAAPVVEEPIKEERIVIPDETPVVAEEEGHIEAEEELKAPASWTPAEREEWSKVPKQLQQRMINREREISQTLTTTAQDRKLAEEFKNLVTPYEPIIRAEGATPMQAVSTLMQTAATLQTGSPQAKAQRVAELIKHYGIDLYALDSILAGAVPQQDPQAAQLDQMLQQRLAPYEQMMWEQQLQRQRQMQEMQNETRTEWQNFANSHEFATDLRSEIADILELSSRRGQQISLEDAYSRAIAMRPDIAEVIQSRKASAEAERRRQEMAGKQAASASVGNSGAVRTGEQAPIDMRAQIEKAMSQ
jgi:hypothetical protein